MSAFPNFIIIGVEQCGAKVLGRNLSQHPEITMGQEHFTGSFNGEVRIDSIESKEAMSLIAKEAPDMNLIVCVRNPVLRAYSKLQSSIRENPKNKSKTFNTLVKSGTKIFERGRYFNMLSENVLPFFKKVNIHVSVQEWMRKDTVGELNKIYNFLGLDGIELEVSHLRASNLESDNDGSYIEWKNKPSSIFKRYHRKAVAREYWADNKMFYRFFGQAIPEWDEKVFPMKKG